MNRVTIRVVIDDPRPCSALDMMVERALRVERQHTDDRGRSGGYGDVTVVGVQITDRKMIPDPKQICSTCGQEVSDGE